MVQPQDMHKRVEEQGEENAPRMCSPIAMKLGFPKDTGRWCWDVPFKEPSLILKVNILRDLDTYLKGFGTPFKH